MRKIMVVTFMTMDGVLQAPGGDTEDTTGGFTYGGWQFAYGDDAVNEPLGKIFSQPFDLLLGRRTYEIFAAYWPYHNDEIGEKFNRIHKYVVATTPIDTSWNNSVLINSDVVNELKKLKESDGPALLVHGSGVLVQTLLANRLVDELHTWIYPITLGQGKKLFAEGTQPQEWKMTESLITPSGTILATYTRGADEIKKSTFDHGPASEADIARRKKWAQEEKNV